MPVLHFSLPFVQFLADHRNPVLTRCFLGASAMGAAPCYVALIMLIYVAWDKRLAVRLSYLVLLAMSLNDVLKNLIRNPRPFLSDGSYLHKWAVSASQKQALAAEYSTPSGHAMAASSFYLYLIIFVRKRWAQIGAGLAILLIGFSRPYLGVHYGEDVLIGWAIGLCIAALAARYSEAMSALWRACPYPLQIALAVSLSLALCLVSIALDGWHADSRLAGTVTYAGFLTGNVIACPLEVRWVGFDAASGTAVAKLLRFLLTIGMIAAVVLVLKLAFADLALPASAPGLALGYVCYAAAAAAGMFAAPFVFTRMGLAQTKGAGCEHHQSIHKTRRMDLPV